MCGRLVSGRNESEGSDDHEDRRERLRRYAWLLMAVALMSGCRAPDAETDIGLNIPASQWRFPEGEATNGPDECDLPGAVLVAGGGHCRPVVVPAVEAVVVAAPVAAEPVEPVAVGAVVSVPAGPRPGEVPGLPLGRGDVLGVIAAAGWPEYLWAQALQVSFCESGYYDPDTGVALWKPFAVGDHGRSLGLFQLWSGWFGYSGLAVEAWADPVTNARAALGAYGYSGGWGQWSCKP